MFPPVRFVVFFFLLPVFPWLLSGCCLCRLPQPLSMAAVACVPHGLRLTPAKGFSCPIDMTNIVKIMIWCMPVGLFLFILTQIGLQTGNVVGMAVLCHCLLECEVEAPWEISWPVRVHPECVLLWHSNPGVRRVCFVVAGG